LTVARLRRVWAADLTPAQLYELLRLRIDVFAVEQDCVYQDLDGRDLDQDTRHFWIEDGAGEVVACLRLLAEPDGEFLIGRVVTAKSARRRGLANRLMLAALADIGDAPCRLNAQVYATPLYASVGFAPVGEQFLEDGIPHLPMRRQPVRS
jgi:ElaA protein